MISAKEMRILENNSEYLNVSKLELMENAGKAVCDVLRKKFNLKDKKILVVCWHGNNGGDGFVAARYLNQDFYVKVLFTGDKKKFTPEAGRNFSMLNKKLFVSDINLKKYDIIIDALLGTGTKGSLREPILSTVKKINSSKAFKVSLDIPTGFNLKTGKISGECVKADLVITFHDIKTGIENLCNKIVDIGIPADADKFAGPGELREVVKVRKPRSHKGDFGKVLIIGGSEDYVGAPILAGEAAFASGVDIVTITAPEKIAFAINTYNPDLITKKLKGDYFSIKHIPELLKLSKRFDSVLIGPGLGRKSDDFVRELCVKLKKPAVIDADAVKALRLQDIDNAILTPHSKEFQTLRDNSGMKKIKPGTNVILKKGSVDEIISRSKVKHNKTGNPGMTVGGTGDVLAGLCAGFLAQSNDLFNSACAAAFISGLAGDSLNKKLGNGFTASSVVKEIPVTIKKML